MEYVLSRHGGVKKNDQIANALFAYPKELEQKLQRSNMSLCGYISHTIHQKDTTIIGYNGDQYIERGVPLITAGKFFDYDQSPMQEFARTIQYIEWKEKRILLPASTWYQLLQIDVKLYEITGKQGTEFLCIHHVEEEKSVLEHSLHSFCQRSEISAMEEAFSKKPVGLLQNIPISLFQDIKRPCGSPILQLTSPAIIFPQHSTYENFWISFGKKRTTQQKVRLRKE